MKKARALRSLREYFKNRALLSMIVVSVILSAFLAVGFGFRSKYSFKKWTLTKDGLSRFLGDSASFYRFPATMDLPVDGVQNSEQRVRVAVHYSFDPKLQEDMESLFRSYKPDYGAFV